MFHRSSGQPHRGKKAIGVDMNLQRRDLLLWVALAATAGKPALAQDTAPRGGPAGGSGQTIMMSSI
jgi:hypothetical protein